MCANSCFKDFGWKSTVEIISLEMFYERKLDFQVISDGSSCIVGKIVKSWMKLAGHIVRELRQRKKEVAENDDDHG